MSKINAIGQTLFNGLTGISKKDEYQELKKQRLAVCSQCLLFKKDNILGKEVYVCNSDAFVEVPVTVVNAENRLVESTKNVYGCGCTLDNMGSLLPEKTVLVGEETCPLYKWNNIEKDCFYIEEYTKDFIEINKLDLNTIQYNIDLQGIVDYCNARNLTLRLKPSLKELENIEHTYFNIVALKRSNDVIEYFNYNQINNKTFF